MNLGYNNNVPFSSNDPADDQPQMLLNTQSISSWCNIDHYGYKNANGGLHRQVTFAGNNVPSTPVSPPVLFTQISNSLPQLFFYSGGSTKTTDQYTLTSEGSTFLFGGIIMKWGFVSFTGGSTHKAGDVVFPKPFPNDCFNVSATLIVLNISVTNPRNTIAVTALTTTQFTAVYNGESPGSTNYPGFFWTAIGN